MKRLFLIFFLLGTMTAMAQEDFNELHFNSQGPKVKQVSVATNKYPWPEIYLFDTLGRNYAKGRRWCDTMPYHFEPIDTVNHYFHRTDKEEWEELTVDSMFLNVYITKMDSIMRYGSPIDCIKLSDSTSAWRQIYDTTILVQVSYIDDNNDTLQKNDYFISGQLSSSRHYQYDDNHHIKKAIEYDFFPSGEIGGISILTFDKKGHLIRTDYFNPDGRKTISKVCKRDRNGHIILYKEVGYNLFNGGKRKVSRWHYKYKFDKHGNWTTCKCYPQHKRFIGTTTREITYWE